MKCLLDQDLMGAEMTELLNHLNDNDVSIKKTVCNTQSSNQNSAVGSQGGRFNNHLVTTHCLQIRNKFSDLKKWQWKDEQYG